MWHWQAAALSGLPVAKQKKMSPRDIKHTEHTEEGTKAQRYQVTKGRNELHVQCSSDGLPSVFLAFLSVLGVSVANAALVFSEAQLPTSPAPS